MKRSILLILTVALAGSIWILSLISCSQNDKIPITTSSKDALENYLQGRDLFDKLQAQESVPYFKAAIEADPNFAIAYLNLAFTAPSNKEFFENLNKAVALIDKISEGEKLWIKGVEAGVNGFPMKQRDYYEMLIKRYPNDERAYNLLGTNFFVQQEWAKAIGAYSRATDINPDFSQPYNQLGYAYRFLGKYDEAEKAFKKYIQLIPNDPNPYDSYAELLMKIGKFEESIDQYRKALTYNPNFVPSHIGIATNLNFLDRHDEARAELKKLEAMARNDGERRAAWLAMTVSYVDEGNMDKALETLSWQFESNKKINDHTAMAGNLNLMGNVLLESGKIKEAIKKFDAALEIVEQSDRSEEVKDNFRRGYLFNTAYAAVKQSDLAKAKNKASEYAKQAEEINNPNLTRASHRLNGIIALAEKEFDKATKELEHSSMQNPYNLYRLALAYKGMGDAKNAELYLQKAIHFNGLNNINYAFVRNIMRK
ncbi:MAG: tetratricopeptide repeat protein [Calditrichaceae bacterium]